MNPEEKVLLERTLKLSEENNALLKKIERRARLALLWWFVKVVVIAVPLIVGYFYLEPYFNQALDNYRNIRENLRI